MREFNQIKSSTLLDPKVRGLLPADRFAWLVLLICPEATYSGVYRLEPATLAEYLDGDEEAARASLRRLEDHGLIRYDWRLKVLWLVNRIRHERVRSPQQWKGARATMEHWPDACFMRDLALRYPALGIPVDTLTNRVSAPPADTLCETPPQGGMGIQGEGEGEGEKRTILSPPDGADEGGGAPAASPPTPPPSCSARAVVEAWNEAAAGTPAVSVRWPLHPRRLARLRAACKAEPDVEIWRATIRLLLADEHMMGHNDRGKVYARLDYLLQSNSARFWDAAKDGAAPGFDSNGNAKDPFRTFLTEMDDDL